MKTITITANDDQTFTVSSAPEEPASKETDAEDMNEGAEESQDFKSIDEALNAIREMLGGNSDAEMEKMFNTTDQPSMQKKPLLPNGQGKTANIT